MHHVKLKNGFTLVEVLVVAPIVILVIGVLISAIIALTGDALVESSKVSLMNDVQNAVDRIESDVKVSGAFLSSNNITVVSPQGYNNATQSFTNVGLPTGEALILNSFATTQNPALSTRKLVYLAGMPNACGSASESQNQVMTYNTVYFVRDNTLWKRNVFTNTYNSRKCPSDSVWQRPSCAPGVTGTLCLGQDEALVTAGNGVSLAIEYYAAPSDATSVAGAKTGTNANRQIAMDSTRTVRVTVSASRMVAGREVSQTISLRIMRLGSLITYTTPI
jgi:type II secretory pathway pseudopilin PulG